MLGRDGAEDRPRRGTGSPPRPSTVRVYQFRHFGAKSILTGPARPAAQRGVPGLGTAGGLAGAGAGGLAGAAGMGTAGNRVLCWLRTRRAGVRGGNPALAAGPPLPAPARPLLTP